MMASPYLFRSIGESILRRASNGNDRAFVALFGLRPLEIYQLWGCIVESHNREKIAPKHLMWALLFLRSYGREEVLATMVGVTEKTMRQWIWTVVHELARVDTLIVWENRFIGVQNCKDKCFVSVDGTDLPIREPIRPVDPKWYSHKLNRAAVRYELAIAIHTGWIVWVNGPYPVPYAYRNTIKW